ncbi:MAG TPA: NYN domain-containing protein [Isosphaeraceae bacterium]|jgi:hypothetical protein|nr:NYN domain-containing protein [Isosphaeraceae bacterium]
MRTLIDGYNVMYAAGLLGRRLPPDGLRKVRHRFLNDLAATLGVESADQTTIVFDAAAAAAPPGAPRESKHKGMTVVFAVDDEDADARLEDLIAHHPAPKSLTVVSSDHRVRQAAARRKAKVTTADDFLDRLDSLRSRPRPRRPPPPPADPSPTPSPAETAYWLAQFADLASAPETRAALEPADFVPTDDDLARIAREVDQEP